MRGLRRELLDEMRLMRIRQHRTMDSLANEVIATGLKAMKQKELADAEGR